MENVRKVAYFSMEIGIVSEIPTYAGGLGVLAGDSIRSAADLKLPLVAMTLLHRTGYFTQTLDVHSGQNESPTNWQIENFLVEESARVSVQLENRTVQIRVWKYEVQGVSGFRIPVYFLDTNLPENSEYDRSLSDYLYGGDRHYRLCQEAILGIGGIRMLRALGYHQLEIFHLNEGHSSFLTLELLDEHMKQRGRASFQHEDLEAVRKKCVFTTHTPVLAGHDRFPIDQVRHVIGRYEIFELEDVFRWEGTINMTHLALHFSHYANGVSKRHAEVSKRLFSGFTIDAITNGVHAAFWTTKPFQALFDRHIPGWRVDNYSLKQAVTFPHHEIWEAHAQAKHDLLDVVEEKAGVKFESEAFTIGYARRFTAYKRPDLLFADIQTLKRLAEQFGTIQLVFAGKAHPHDHHGKELLKRVLELRGKMQRIQLVVLENYDINLGRVITAGVDLWLNNPDPPLEASGTSGMKAALNGVPSLSVLDGWWTEGWIEGITGWAIDEKIVGTTEENDMPFEATSIYQKLEHIILPLYYRNRTQYIEVMRQTIGHSGAFFNTQRMIQQYLAKAYSW